MKKSNRLIVLHAVKYKKLGDTEWSKGLQVGNDLVFDLETGQPVWLEQVAVTHDSYELHGHLKVNDITIPLSLS
ncbi:hypothetical protein D1872_51480 [compost metagenome]